MILPSNNRRQLNKLTRKRLWVYAVPFAGKTTLANQFPDPLFLNTDGNINSFDGAYLSIKDQVTQNGRITERKFAWAVFKDIIEELEKGENDFKTIVVDLLEDTYEMCRVYMYDKLNISHESDSTFKAWDMVRNEFLNTIKRLMNLDYENILLISHEDQSKDITKSTGDKITSIKPNINDKVALKLAGMVDVVTRIVIDGDTRKLSFKCDNVIFGGGRLGVKNAEIPLNYDALIKVYEKANETFALTRTNTPVNRPEPVKPVVDEPMDDTAQAVAEPVKTVAEPTPVVAEETKAVAEEPRTRTRRVRN